MNSKKLMVQEKRRGGGVVAVQKRCEMCGNPIEAQDNRRKYCDGCRKARKSLFDAAALDKYRKAARDKRKQDAERRKQLEAENQRLRELLTIERQLRIAAENQGG